MFISWDIDNSNRVVNKNSKEFPLWMKAGCKSFNWPRKGAYNGKIYLSSVNSYLLDINSGLKKDMDAKAIELTKSASADCIEEQMATVV